MRAVWKYPIKTRVNRIEMPEGAWVLKVGAETGEPCLWALADVDKPKVMRRFMVIGTGWKVSGWPEMGSAYKGTFFVNADPRDPLSAFVPPVLVYHVFELHDEKMAREFDDELAQV